MKHFVAYAQPDVAFAMTSHEVIIRVLQAVPTAMKGAYFSCGQNCAGGERFFIQEGIYDQFLQQVPFQLWS